MPARTTDGGTTVSRACAIRNPESVPLVERRPAGQQVVGHCTQRVNVAPLIHVSPTRGLLR
jgi:hypothetical protein